MQSPSIYLWCDSLELSSPIKQLTPLKPCQPVNRGFFEKPASNMFLLLNFWASGIAISPTPPTFLGRYSRPGEILCLVASICRLFVQIKDFWRLIKDFTIFGVGLNNFAVKRIAGSTMALNSCTRSNVEFPHLVAVAIRLRIDCIRNA